MTVPSFSFANASFLSTKPPLLLLKTCLNFKLDKNMQLIYQESVCLHTETILHHLVKPKDFIFKFYKANFHDLLYIPIYLFTRVAVNF